jgi:hypothetical protein
MGELLTIGDVVKSEIGAIPCVVEKFLGGGGHNASNIPNGCVVRKEEFMNA